MTARLPRVGACGAMVILLAFLAGCASAPDGKTAPATDRRAELERLRANRDRAFAELDGRGPDAGPAETSAPAGRSEATADMAPSTDVSRAENDLPPPRTGEKPAWVESGRSARHPDGEFILGVGSCRTQRGQDSAALSLAEDRARSSVAKQIRVNLQSEFKSTVDLVTEARTGDPVVEKDRTGIREKITSVANLQLDGLQLADRYYDKKAKTYWALAVLDRAATGKALLERIGRQIARLEQDYILGGRHFKRGSVFQALKYFNRAREASLPILNLRAQLRAIAPLYAETADMKKCDDLMKSLWREAALASDKLRFGVVAFAAIDGKPVDNAHVEATLSAKLREMGLGAAKIPKLPAGATFDKMKDASADALRGWLGGEANCLVLATVDTESIGSEVLITLRVYFYEAKGELCVLDLADARVVASTGFALSNKTRASNRIAERAAEAALVNAAGMLVGQLEKELPKELNLTD